MSKFYMLNTPFDRSTGEAYINDEKVKPALIDNYHIPFDVLCFISDCINRIQGWEKTTILDIDVSVYHYDLYDSLQHNCSVNILTSKDYQEYIDYYFDREGGHVFENQSTSTLPR